MIDKLEDFCLKILRKIKLGKLADVYEDHKEGMRYLIFGALSTIVNILVATLTYYVMFKTLSENIRVNLSTILAIIAAWIFAYITNKLYVFDSKTNNIKELFKEIISFIGCRMITAIVEIVIMNIFVTRLQFSYMIMKIISNVIVIILNFVFSKLIIFKPNNSGKEKDNLEKIEDNIVGEFIYKYRFLIGLILLIICVCFEISGSSIGQWQNIIGDGIDDSSNIILGTSRNIRSDEWAVLTPMMFSQHFDGFHYFSNLLRGESTDVFMVYGLPVLSLLQIYRPFQLGFLFLGISKGLSFFWCGRFIVLFLVSFEFFMILSKKNKLLSLVGAFMMALAPQIQWWFAVNGIAELFTFGELALILLYNYMKEKELKNRLIYLLFMVICAGGYVLVFYPAWQIPLFYVFFMLAIWIIVENRKECKIDLKDIVAIIIALALFGISMFYIIHNSFDTIRTVMQTVYPGSRVELGGDVKRKYFDYLLNIFLSYNEEGLDLNTCDKSVMFGLFPIGIILSITAMIKNKKLDLVTVLLGIVYGFLSCYCFFGFPEIIAKITLMSKSMGIRAFIAVGFIDIILLIRGLTITQKSNKIWSALLVSVLMAGLMTVGCKILNSTYIDKKMAVIILSYIICLFYFALRYKNSKICRILFAVEIIVVMLINGLYVNPIRRGVHVIYDDPIIQEAQKINADDNNAKWLVNDISYPVTNYLLMAGVPVINSTNTYPDLERWRMFDSNGNYEDVYNRYAHIIVKVCHSEEEYVDKFQLLNGFDLIIIYLLPEEVEKLDVKYIFTTDSLEDYSTENIKFEQIFNYSGYFIYKMNVVE